jgi:penicillin-binding protein 1C
MAGDRPLINWLRKRKRRLLLAGLLAALALFFWFSLPEPLFTDRLSPVLLAADGRLLDARLAADEQWRFPRLKSVPNRFFQVLLQYEDRRFFLHRGVDPLAVARAMAQNLKQRRIVSGGSTITMQVIRSARKNRGRTFLEKFREMLLALRLELRCSKKDPVAVCGQRPVRGQYRRRRCRLLVLFRPQRRGAQLGRSGIPGRHPQ